MPAHLKYQWRFASAGTDRANDMINDWHFQVEATPPSPTTMTAINTALTTFYQANAAQFSTQIITGLCDVKVYNMADPKPRNPVTTYFPTLTGLSSAAAMMPEVCHVVTYEASKVSGISQRRRRGRVYLPCFIVSQYTANGFLGNTLVNNLKAAAAALLTASDAAADWSWCVYSPTSDALAPVSDGWVDNAPDIQRRRGLQSFYRATYP